MGLRRSLVDNLRIGVDIGGTKILVAAVHPNGAIIAQERLAVQDPAPQILIQEILEAIEKLKAKTKSPFLSIGIGIAGQIKPEEGIVAFAPNLEGWHDVPVKQMINERLDLPVALVNDVRAAAYGEWLYGAGKNCSDFVCLFIGTGIGGGIFSGNRLLTGTSNTAGELGHMTLDLNGPLCTCGNRGCLEALASGWALTRDAREGIQKDRRRGRVLLQLADAIPQVNTYHILRAAKEGDPLSVEIVQNALDAIAAGCVNIVNVFNPQKLILGGGLGLALPGLAAYVSQRVQKYALKTASKPLSVLEAHLGAEANVIGAACYTKSFKP